VSASASSGVNEELTVQNEELTHHQKKLSDGHVLYIWKIKGTGGPFLFERRDRL
jgi:hypothetical protein